MRLDHLLLSPDLAGRLVAANGTAEVNNSIISVSQASDAASKATAKMLEAANGLSAQSDQLKAEVQGFLGSLHAA